MMGDFSGSTNSRTGSEVVGPYGEDRVNGTGERLIELCEQHSLRITNEVYQHKDIHTYSRHQETFQQGSAIDYIIVGQKTSLKVQDVKVFRGPSCGSDRF